MPPKEGGKEGGREGGRRLVSVHMEDYLSVYEEDVLGLDYLSVYEEDVLGLDEDFYFPGHQPPLASRKRRRQGGREGGREGRPGRPCRHCLKEPYRCRRRGWWKEGGRKGIVTRQGMSRGGMRNMGRGVILCVSPSRTTPWR